MTAAIWPRRCRTCGEAKDAADMVANPKSPGGVETVCRDCDRARRKADYRRNRDAAMARIAKWNADHPDERREYNRRNRFRSRGVDYPDGTFDRLAEAQNGRCAICGDPPRRRTLHVDHDHETNEIRGLLCDWCNRGLGLFVDDPERLEAAAAYIRRHRP